MFLENDIRMTFLAQWDEVGEVEMSLHGTQDEQLKFGELNI